MSVQPTTESETPDPPRYDRIQIARMIQPLVEEAEASGDLYTAACLTEAHSLLIRGERTDADREWAFNTAREIAANPPPAVPVDGALGAVQPSAEAAHTAGFTPGPWEAKLSVYSDGTYSAHWSVQTVNKLPEHPWSPRVVTWMTGCLASDIHNNRVKGATYCKECGFWHFRGWREVGFDVRVDDRIEADAHLIAAAPTMYEALQGLMPTNVCLTNPNIGDDVIVPCDVTMGELRRARAALARAEGRSV